MPWRFKFVLLTVFTVHYIMRRLPPPLAKKRDRTTTNEWGKSCNLQLACVLAGRPSWPSLKYPGHNNSTRATQANLQLRCVTVINIRCLSSHYHPWRNTYGWVQIFLVYFTKKSMQGCKKSLAEEWLKIIFFPVDVCPTG